MRIKAKRISKLKSPPQWGPAIVTEVHRQLSNDNTVLRLAQEIVNDWDHKPGFGVQVINRGGALVSKLMVLGKNAKIWQYVSGGTRPHIIRPRKAKALAFPWGGPGSYKPKTTPRGKTATFGGPGTVSNAKMTYRQEVHHPGTEARDLEGLIRNKYAPTFSRIIRKAIKAGAAQARKGIRISYRPGAHSRRRRG